MEGKIMFNLLRMDLYRLKRSKSIYACLGVLFVLSALCYFLVWLMESPSGRETALKWGMIELTELSEMEAEGSVLEEMDMLTMFRDMGMDGGVYCTVLGIAVTLFVCMDFQSGFMKNIMASHRNRWSYVGSKLLTAGILNLCYIVISFAFCLLANLLLQMVPFTEWEPIFFYLAWAWLISTAFAALIIMICVFTRNTAMGVLGAVLFGSGVIVSPIASLMNLFHAGGWIKYTLYYNMTYGPSAYSEVGDLKVFAVGLVFLVFYTVIASVGLTRQDI